MNEINNNDLLLASIAAEFKPLPLALIPRDDPISLARKYEIEAIASMRLKSEFLIAAESRYFFRPK
jgi:hypothetical protein